MSNYQTIRDEIPKEVEIVVAIKGRIKEEVLEVIEEGAKNIGENYVQEAEQLYLELGTEAKKVKWHLIGHLQTNKIKRALKIFDVIQTVDSYEKAKKINNLTEKKIEIYLQINIANEENKSGVKPSEDILEIIKEISRLENIKLTGLMVMGKPGEELENFKAAKKIFDQTKLTKLSMGMSNSYLLAVENGSNMIRIGTKIFVEKP